MDTIEPETSAAPPLAAEPETSAAPPTPDSQPEPKPDYERVPGTNLPVRRGRLDGVGRQKGTPNGATKQIKEITRAITLGNKKVVKRLKEECENGKINPIVFNKLLEYAYGKVKVAIEFEDKTPQSGIKELAEAMKKNLSKEELRLMAELTRKALREPITVDAIVTNTAPEVDPESEPEYAESERE